MGKVIDFHTRLAVENTGFNIPLDKIRGVAEHKKVFHVVYKRYVYEVNKRTLEVRALIELPNKGSGLMKSPVQMVANKYYSVIIDNENIFMVDVDSKQAAHIWYPGHDMDEFTVDDE